MTENERINKFRGKPVGGGNFVYGSLVQAADGCFIFEEETVIQFREPPYSSVGVGLRLENSGITDRYQAAELGFREAVKMCAEWHPVLIEVNPETVGQFIGLLDKNRKEIYEGDILRNGWHENEIGVVEFSYGSFGLGFGYLETISTQAEDCEVIGNIYEAPELLRV